MNTEKKHFLIGGSLVPLGLYTHMPMNEWEKSFKQMHDLGFNAFRMFLSWSRVERKEGILDFSQNDYAFELAEKYNLKVLVNVGGLFNSMQGFTSPAWLVHKYHLTQIRENPLINTSYENPTMQICPDDPLYREKAFDFIRTSVNRYKNHPMLEGWSVWNEPHENACYCEHTLEKFRVWLKKKYKSLDLLNEKWGSWYPVDFLSWEEVRPVYKPSGAQPLVMKMDFLTFCRENYTNTFNLLCELIHTEDPDHTTTLNMQGIHGRDITDFHAKTRGISAYFEAFHNPRRIYTWANLYMRSARINALPEEKVRVLETDSGPRPDNEERAGCQKHASVCDWSMVAMGAEEILTWIYRTRIDGGHSLQSQMCDFYGDLTPRLQEFAARAKIIRENEDLILSSHPYPGEIGIWWDISSYHYGITENKFSSGKDFISSSHDNALMAALDSGYEAEYVNDKMVLSGEISRFKSLIIPYRPYMTQALADALKLYVANGGLLIAESPFAVKDENMCQTWRPTPGGLKEVFGCDVHDMMLFEKDKDYIELKTGERLSAYRYKMVMRPDAGTQIVARFADNSPAITSHSYGKGKAILMGALVTPEYERNSALRIFLAAEWQKQGITRYCQPSCQDEVGIYPVTKDGKKISILYIINYAEEAREVEIKPDEKFLAGTLFQDLISNKEYILPCKVTLEPLQSLVLAAKE